MALHRRAFFISLAAVAIAGCTTDEPVGTPSSTRTESESESPPPATEPGYASCDPEMSPGENLHTAGEIPSNLSERSAKEYAKALEEDIVLPPPEERNEGYLGFGEVTAETVEYGYVVTVEVTGGYQRGDPEGTATGTHADLGQHVATYFMNEQVVRRAEDNTVELDPREAGEVVVCNG